MQRKTVAATMAGLAAAVAALPFLLTKAAAEHTQPAAEYNLQMKSARPSRQSFEDLQAIAQHFADELGRLKEQNQTVSPLDLAEQANAENTCAVSTLADPGKKLDTETIYARARPGVVVVGGIFKCTKCNRWHVQCASGFVVRQDGLIMTNLHTLEGCKKLDTLGAMTDDGRVFPVRAVLASSRLNDLALLKLDVEGLRPLPVSDNVSVGATVYCLSHPVLSSGKTNCFYTFSQGIVCGKFTVHSADRQPLKVLAITADYGPGSSGAPILNEHGAVVAMACQAIPLFQREHEKDVQMVWKITRPSCSILALLSRTVIKCEPAGGKNSLVASRSTLAAAVERPPQRQPAASRSDAIAAPLDRNPRERPSASGGITFELQPRDKIMVGYYRPVAVKLTEEPPVPPRAEPKYQAKRALYGVLQLGDADDNRFLVALDEPENGEPKIYIDRHGDGDLASSGPGNWDRSAGHSFFVGNVMIDVPYQTGKIPYNFSFYRLQSRLPDRLFYYRNSGREGEVVLDGNRYQVLVLDDNSNGRFDDLHNGSLIIDLNQDGKLEASPDSAEYFSLSEPFNVRGKVWEVASMSPDGLHVTFQPSKADVPIKPYLNPGYPAPEFTGQGLDGRPIDLKTESTKGKYLLLDFWASWCGPCRAEFPTLRRVYDRYKNHGLTVIGVNLDSELAKAVDVANQAKLTYPHVFDGQGWKNAVALLYRVRGIPQIYLLDDQLKIVGKNLRGPELEKRLRDLLGPGDDGPQDR